jgi:hypothetical protein
MGTRQQHPLQQQALMSRLPAVLKPQLTRAAQHPAAHPRPLLLAAAAAAAAGLVEVAAVDQPSAALAHET